MSYSIQLSDQAIDDLVDAQEYLERTTPSALARFLREFDSLLDLLESNPRIFQEYLNAIRRAPMNRSRYNVFYRIGNNGVLIIAIVSQKADSRNWPN
ncbi:MAG: type II toxin-antitoxin system RelE/ParE family toxin [Bacteroidia bacterium]